MFELRIFEYSCISKLDLIEQNSIAYLKSAQKTDLETF